MSITFNQEMNIAKAIGIVAIVAGHVKWNLFGDFFTNYSFHIPLFFFIAGYFFKSELIENSDIFIRFTGFIKKIAVKYLGVFYLYHIFYGGITVAVYILFDRLYGKLPTLKNLTLSPIDSTPFSFSSPNWFIYQLAISLIVFAVIMIICKKINKNNYFPIVIFLPLAITSILISKDDFGSSYGFTRVLIRTLISLFYIYAGYLYKTELEKKIKYNIKTLLIVFTIHIAAYIVCNTKVNLGLIFAQIHHNISPFIIPFTGIYFVIFISKLIAPLITRNSLIEKIGQNTLHTMANHKFVIFLIQLIIFCLDGKSLNQLPNELTNLYYKIYKYKFLYTFVSIIICTYIGEGLSYTVKFIKFKFNKKPTEGLYVQSDDVPALPLK